MGDDDNDFVYEVQLEQLPPLPAYMLIYWQSRGGWAAHEVVAYSGQDYARAHAVVPEDITVPTWAIKRVESRIPQRLTIDDHDFAVVSYTTMVALRLRGDIACVHTRGTET